MIYRKHTNYATN